MGEVVINRSSVLNRSCEWRDFVEFIKLRNFVDIPSKGKKFTWFGWDGKTRSRTDRFLVAGNVVSNGALLVNWGGD